MRVAVAGGTTEVIVCVAGAPDARPDTNIADTIVLVVLLEKDADASPHTSLQGEVRKENHWSNS